RDLSSNVGTAEVKVIANGHVGPVGIDALVNAFQLGVPGQAATSLLDAKATGLATFSIDDSHPDRAVIGIKVIGGPEAGWFSLAAETLPQGMVSNGTTTGESARVRFNPAPAPTLASARACRRAEEASDRLRVEMSESVDG